MPMSDALSACSFRSSSGIWPVELQSLGSDDGCLRLQLCRQDVGERVCVIRHTSSACLPPSYRTARTLTFSRLALDINRIAEPLRLVDAGPRQLAGAPLCFESCASAGRDVMAHLAPLPATPWRARLAAGPACRGRVGRERVTSSTILKDLCLDELSNSRLRDEWQEGVICSEETGHANSA